MNVHLTDLKMVYDNDHTILYHEQCDHLLLTHNYLRIGKCCRSIENIL